MALCCSCEELLLLLLLLLPLLPVSLLAVQLQGPQVQVWPW